MDFFSLPPILPGFSRESMSISAEYNIDCLAYKTTMPYFCIVDRTVMNKDLLKAVLADYRIEKTAFALARKFSLASAGRS